MGNEPDMGETPLSPYPFHPSTGLQALGRTSRGWIWPVMGGSEDGEQGEPEPQETEKGFPENTPVAQMTDAQKAAYYKHQNRQSDNKLQAFHGFTPDDVNNMWTRIQEFEAERLTADQKALKEATEQAATAARSEAETEWKAKVQQLQLENIASRVIRDDGQLQAFLAITDPGKFVGEDGQIDQEKVKTHLTPFLGTNGDRQWGQHGSRPPGKSASEEGLAEARRRGYIKD